MTLLLCYLEKYLVKKNNTILKIQRSSEIPFVSGIRNRTNTSWRTIIPANNMKTYPGFGNADKATGMKSVISAASTPVD